MHFALSFIALLLFNSIEIKLKDKEKKKG